MDTTILGAFKPLLGGIAMLRLSLCIMLVGIAFLRSSFSSAADPSPENSSAGKPTAAELVQEIIDAENKVQEVHSLHLRFEGIWTRTPEAIAAARAELQKQNPGQEIDDKRYSNLWPEMTEELELAFDERRVRSFSDWHGSRRDLRIFDGSQAIAHGKYFTHEQEYYTLRPQPDEFFNHFFIDLSWLRVGTPSFWFLKDQFTPEQRAEH